MPAPVLDGFAARLYAATAPLSPTDGDNDGWPLAWFCAGLAEVLRPYEDLTAPTALDRDSLARLLDPDAAPAWALPWLAMATGTKLQTGLSELASREAIKQTPGQDRGTVPAIIGAARRHTTDPVGAPFIFSSPYNGSLAEALLVVYSAQAPDVAAIEADLPLVAPAWMKITLRVDDGWAVGDLETAYAGKTVGAVETDYASIQNLELHQPNA
jgi:hypothetical protein